MPNARVRFHPAAAAEVEAAVQWYAERNSIAAQAFATEVNACVVPLFNPRQHVWSEHFVWSVDGLPLLGLTPCGRATITASALNRERMIAIRAADIAVGRHPPPGDPREPVPPSS